MLANRIFNHPFPFYISISSNLKTSFEELLGDRENKFLNLHEKAKKLIDYLNWCYLAQKSGMRYANLYMNKKYI